MIEECKIGQDMCTVENTSQLAEGKHFLGMLVAGRHMSCSYFAMEVLISFMLKVFYYWHKISFCY